MSSKIMIRLAGTDDFETLVKFNRAMARETESRELLLGVVSAGVSALLEKPELGFYIVAERDGEVVGSLMVTTEWSDWRNGTFWWIQSVYVLPKARRQGIYRRLYEFVKIEAERQESVCGFRLYVERDNVPAQRTYCSLGMIETHYKVYEELRQNSKFFDNTA